MARVGGEEIDLTPTEGMANEAQKALDWRKDGFDGGTPVGLARARQLVNKQELSPSTVRRMHSFFSRHEVDKQGEGFRPGEPGFPSNGRVAWALWGGDPGQTWARAKSATLDRLEGKSIDYTKEFTDEDEVEEKAGPKDLKLGDFVEWNSSGGKARGRIEHIMREGTLGVPGSSFSIEASKEDPAALIRIYRNDAETETLVGHKFSTLTKIPAITGKSMNKIFKLDSAIKSIEEDREGELKIAGYASTNAMDRSSDRILSTAWTKGGLNNFQNNPILLFNHNYDKPIGKVVEIVTDNTGLKIKGIISKSAGDVYNLVKEGVLSTFSVGFLIKDAEYDKSVDGLVVKDAELLEVSVVSIPCNQTATFSVAKSFDNQEDYQKFTKQFETALGGQPSAETGGSSEDALAASRKLKMDEQNTQEMINKAVADALAASQKAQDEKAAKAAAEKAAEIAAMTNSKRVFSDRGGNSADWKKTFAADMEDAYMLARITGKGYNTDFGKQLLEKVNTHSSVSVSSADFEQEVSTNIERDIQNELILAPMFREIAMNTASMIVPIMPDTGYAEITSNAGSTDATAANGTLDVRGGTNRAGIALTEIELRTIKMVAKSYLGNETEEDAIMPILPLLREAMIRQHARGVENMILLGGHADGAYSGITAASGLLKYASSNSRDINTGTAGTLPALTAAGLLTLRKNMGKYGLRASDVGYIVSQRAYFELLEDAEFQDFNLVNTAATKLSGEVGQVFGSPVMVCDEFPDAAAGKYYALAVNTRNFVIPRQRGVTVESDYSVEDQHRVLVTSQRLGFKEIIPNAKSVFGFKYPAAS